ncbi:hypothetical protein C2S51_019237 [Perilla frutescens var. frutescens]|nr:hypothetical protein C2S51_019237 [Perilla frutescens var. frutescens]
MVEFVCCFCGYCTFSSMAPLFFKNAYVAFAISQLQRRIFNTFLAQSVCIVRTGLVVR